MPQLDAERVEVANQVRTSLAVENVLSPIQARSFVRGLQRTWEVPTISWRDQESKEQLYDARRLIQAASVFQNVDGDNLQHAIECYRRAGELLEWLSRSDDPIRTTVPIALYASAAYQLGKLPAMASGLLKQVPIDDKGSRLFAHFLGADFDGVLEAAVDFWSEYPELTHRNASRTLLEEESDDKLSWYLVVELVRSLGLVADSLRRGHARRLGRALKKLDGLDKIAARMIPDDASLLVTLLRTVAQRFSEASIYNPILRFAETNRDHLKVLRDFARGQFSRGRGILWPSQQRGLNRLLEESSFALCTPTGSGKTLVANIALIKELLLSNIESSSVPLGLYLVPSRALASEVEAKLRSELGQNFVITGLYGGTDWGITDYWLNADRPTVLVATVEKADALMRYMAPLLLSRLRLLIVDEAHQVVGDETEYTKTTFADHSNRPLRLEGFVSRLISLSPSIARIALTAVAGGAAQPVAQWIEAQQTAEPVGQGYRSTRQVIGMLETSPNRPGAMLLDLMNGHSLQVSDRSSPVYINLTTPVMPQLPASMRNSVYRFNELSVLWTALHLLEGGRRILISLMQSPEKTMKWYCEALALPDWQEAAVFSLPTEEGDRARYLETREACVDYCGDDSYELALLDHGIATNHGQMPQRLRRLMTALIERGICPITLATSTLTEGVNLPFDLIFLTSLRRTGFNQDTSQQVVDLLSQSEFLNLSGRAGRPGSTKGLEGITLVAVPQRPSTTAQSQRRRQQRQVNQLKNDYFSLIRALSEEAATNGDAKSPLAILIETIEELASSVLEIEDDELLDWLDTAEPGAISGHSGRGATSSRARLADSIDELDGFLLAAIEELNAVDRSNVERAELETLLVGLWQHTFARIAAAEENWLEQVVVRRGSALIEEIYPDQSERKRLYQYGFTPYIGRRFESIASEIEAIIEGAADYGRLNAEERIDIFNQLGELLAVDSGFGFRVRDTAGERDLLENRNEVLAWWMKLPGADVPEAKDLRSWQRFVADNWEFRLGTAVGAVVSQSWSDGSETPLQIPSLELWKETTGLPWFGFWAKELLRWGTLDPFVAFSLAQGLAHTRAEAESQRPEFDEWLEEKNEIVDDEDLIDPQLFLEWQRSLPGKDATASPESYSEIELTGTTGELGRYQVIPMLEERDINWIDAAGFSMARSTVSSESANVELLKNDYELVTDGEHADAKIERVF